MLAALLLLGILPFAAMPMFNVDDADDAPSDDTSDTFEGTDQSDGIDLVDDVVDASAVAEEPTGTTYTVEATSGTTVIDGFEPGSDSVEMDLTGIQGDIFFDVASNENGAVLAVSLGDKSVTTLEFSGLGEVPAGDVFLTLSEDATGEPFEMSLSDALVESAPVDFKTVEPAALDPLDPDAPDEPGPTVIEDPIVGPVDPDQPDTPGPANPEPTTVLDPVDPDATGSGGTEANTLSSALVRDSDNTGGLGAISQTLADSGAIETVTGSGDDIVDVADDGILESTDLKLTEGTPHLISDAALDIIDAGSGDDTISIGDEAAYAFGGAGDDVISAGNTVAALFGGDGADELTSTATSGVNVYLDGGSGDDMITGGAGDDILEGGEHGATPVAGDDVINGGAGDDQIRGGHGADTLFGGDGNDVIDHLGNRLERESVTQNQFAWHIDGDADVLDGGAGDDTLILSNGDTATGGTGEDLFWVYNEGSDGAVAAEVTDFKVGEDFLRVSLNPHIGENDEPDVLVRPSDDGLDGLVIVNGDLVAVLRGAPGATVSDVYAEVKLDIFG